MDYSSSPALSPYHPLILACDNWRFVRLVSFVSSNVSVHLECVFPPFPRLKRYRLLEEENALLVLARGVLQWCPFLLTAIKALESLSAATVVSLGIHRIMDPV